MNFKLLPILIFLIYGCGNVDKQHIEKIVKIDTLDADIATLSKECIQRDTTTASGTKIQYIYKKDKIQISWGNESYSRIYDSLYSCQFDKNTGLWDFVPKFKFETKSHLVFINILETSSGGNPAPLDYYAIILSKNNKGKNFEKELFIDCEGEYLVYSDWDNYNIHILNLETNNEQNISLIPKLAPSRAPTMSIKKIEIDNDIFYIKYETLGKGDEFNVVEKEFKLKI